MLLLVPTYVLNNAPQSTISCSRSVLVVTSKHCTDASCLSSTIYCSPLLYTVSLPSIAHRAPLHYTVHSILYCTPFICTALHLAALHSSALHCTVLPDTVLHYTVMYYITPHHNTLHHTSPHLTSPISPHSCQQVIVASVGDVTLTDVERASTAGDAVVLAFNVKMGKCMK